MRPEVFTLLRTGSFHFAFTLSILDVDNEIIIRILSVLRDGGDNQMSEKPIFSSCEKLVDLRKRSALALIVNSTLNTSHLLEVHKIIRNRIFKNLDLILHSGGGQISVAYQIFDLVKTHTEDLVIFIPIYAKSAATLFVLGCDKIVMSELAELGPLDTQVLERKEGTRSYASALNPFKTVEEVQRFALRMFDQSVQLLLNRTDYSIEEAVKHSMEFAAKITAPMFSQIKVEKMGEYGRALQIGLEYGRRLLKRYGHISEEEYDKILRHLIYGYPSHAYVIDYKEMQEIGFKVELPTKEEEEIINEMVVSLVDIMRSGEEEDGIYLIEGKKEDEKV